MDQQAKKSVWCRDQVKIIHTMADGSIRDSVQGYVLPLNENTKHIYHLHAQYIKEHYL